MIFFRFGARDKNVGNSSLLFFKKVSIRKRKATVAVASKSLLEGSDIFEFRTDAADAPFRDFR